MKMTPAASSSTSMKLKQLANDWNEIQLQEKILNERKRALASSTFDVISNTVGKEVADNMYTLRHSTVPSAYQNAYRKLNRYPAEASPLNVLKLIKYVEANPVQ